MMNFETLYQLVKENFNWDDIKWKYRYDDNQYLHRIDIFNSNGAMGYIEWSEDDGEVEKIYVGDKLRRQGLGTYLWELATDYSEKNNLELPQHSSRRSYEGEQFAQSIGGYIPRLTDDIDGWLSRNE
jgi:GNAT superfamily N-acetyltransferase